MRKRVEETRLVSLGNAEAYKTVGPDAMRLVRPPEMLIEQFLPAGMVCGLTSYPGVGKTWLAFEVLRACAAGAMVIGQFKVPRGPSGVLFVGSDSSEADYARQWCRLTAEEHVRWTDSFDPSEPREEWPENPFSRVRFLIQSTFMLDNTDEVRRLVKTVLDQRIFPREKKVIDGETVTAAEGGCSLIVMDTLSRLTSANQNDNTEMEKVFANIRVVCECTGAAVLLLHHNSKPTEFNDGSDWRGAMSQIGALDSWIQLSAHKRDKYKIRAEFKKFRGITPDSFEYQMLVDDPEKASLAWIGQTQGFFGKEDLKDDLLKQFDDWKTVSVAREAMYPAYSDRFTPAKFNKAVENRMADLFPALLDRRPAPRVPGQKGAPANQYKVKESCGSTTTSNVSPVLGSIPTN